MIPTTPFGKAGMKAQLAFDKTLAKIGHYTDADGVAQAKQAALEMGVSTVFSPQQIAEMICEELQEHYATTGKQQLPVGVAIERVRKRARP